MYVPADPLPVQVVLPSPPTESITPKALGQTTEKVSVAVGSAFNAIRALKQTPTDTSSLSTISRYLATESSVNSLSLDVSTTSTSMYQSEEITDIVDHLSKHRPVKQTSPLAALAESKWRGANRTIRNLIQNHLRKYYKTGCTELKCSLTEKSIKKIPMVQK